ncbi:proteasome assembly chaperone 1-like isoform X1 [Asterias rubens]|uniref:proteasome assembly chaperone 1-like isoform X1 n=1 Tax=Asterias rubens TaxID=7604 RepID=UPI0014556515|nr:proteasome assembly chaperone 1-like isoform X1 [Asterias rubens]
MATFFGEVLTLSSRAVDDDDEDEGDEMLPRFPEPQFAWQPGVNKEMEESEVRKLSCRTLIIAVGPAATAFLEAYILWSKIEVVATIEYDLSRSNSAKGHHKCSVYRLKNHPDVLVCQCKNEVLPGMSHVWTKQLFQNLDSTDMEVIVMDMASTAEYRTDMSSSEIPACFLRSMQSSTQGRKIQPCPSLESPNVIKGLSASVLSHCQIYGVSCLLCIGFFDSLFLHTDDIKVFLPLLSSDPIKDIVQENPDAESVLRKLVERRALQGSLYT